MEGVEGTRQLRVQHSPHDPLRLLDPADRLRTHCSFHPLLGRRRRIPQCRSELLFRLLRCLKLTLLYVLQPKLKPHPHTRRPPSTHRPCHHLLVRPHLGNCSRKHLPRPCQRHMLHSQNHPLTRLFLVPGLDDPAVEGVEGARQLRVQHSPHDPPRLHDPARLFSTD